MSTPNKYSRRQFIGTASCAAIGSTTFFSTLFNLGMTNAAAAAARPLVGGDYKALVCILLAGGNDSFNMLIPRGATEYADYVDIRSNLAIPQADLLAINPATNDGKEYGVHPSMPEVQQMFESGRLAFISNVGTLVTPTSMSEILNGTANLPLGLYSHADQIQQWQTSIPDERATTGWAGRMADLLHSMNMNQNISMNISLAGNNLFQSGNQIVEYPILPYGNGSIGITGYGEGTAFNQIRTAAISSMMEQEYQNLFEKTYADITRNAQEAHELFSTAIAGVQPFGTDFSNHYVANSLEMVAKTIAARDVLGACRQTFFVTFGGWDHHDELINKQENMLGVLSKALSDFNTVMEELGLENDVTTFTISDFARTLTSNGNGSDHAWGGNQIIMGGAVNGGDIYGTFPDLYEDNPLDLGRGVLLPTTSADEVFAELALWFGVSSGDLDQVFPNITNFYSPGSPDLPIGFMQV
ncbi:MAG: DUF1501 domain-containing protein [Phaeodactylibacter sp.]|nr:DUF1501 domain-containing protein [Phaeodactylibacter sp.]